MRNTWFTSDHHFGHKNILEYEKESRPFSSLEEMHEVLIDNWNSRIKPNDIVYHLGDFAFGKQHIHIAKLLNGSKRLVMGNHDNYPASEYLKYFDKLHGVLFYKQCILSHSPVHHNGMGARWILNVHGHLHSKKVGETKWIEYDDFPNQKVMTFVEDRNYFNVSVEQNNLKPFHLDQIIERIDSL